MYTFILVMFMGIHPEFNRPVVMFLNKHSTATECFKERDKIIEKVEKEEDKKRFSCIPTINPNYIHEI